MFTFLFYGITILWLCCRKQPQWFGVREISGILLKIPVLVATNTTGDVPTFVLWSPDAGNGPEDSFMLGHTYTFWNTVSNWCHWSDCLLDFLLWLHQHPLHPQMWQSCHKHVMWTWYDTSETLETFTSNIWPSYWAGTKDANHITAQTQLIWCCMKINILILSPWWR